MALRSLLRSCAKRVPRRRARPTYARVMAGCVPGNATRRPRIRLLACSHHRMPTPLEPSTDSGQAGSGTASSVGVAPRGARDPSTVAWLGQSHEVRTPLGGTHGQLPLAAARSFRRESSGRGARGRGSPRKRAGSWRQEPAPLIQVFCLSLSVLLVLPYFLRRITRPRRPRPSRPIVAGSGIRSKSILPALVSRYGLAAIPSGTPSVLIPSSWIAMVS